MLSYGLRKIWDIFFESFIFFSILHEPLGESYIEKNIKDEKNIFTHIFRKPCDNLFIV